jgi:hypothetical protein
MHEIDFSFNKLLDDAFVFPILAVVIDLKQLESQVPNIAEQKTNMIAKYITN